MPAPPHAKVVIIGSGPAGYTAAIYAARAMLEPILIQGIQPGGQLTITTDVENYPGFADVIQGPWLMEQMQKQAEHVGTRLMWDTIVDVDLTSRPFRLTGGIVYNGNEIEGRGRPNADGQYVMNGRGYTAADVGNLDAKVDFQKAAPYIGIGWGNALTPNKLWHFSADLGAFYQGKAHVNLVSRGCTSSRVTCTVLAADVAREEARLSEELSDYKFFPVLRASVSYRF